MKESNEIVYNGELDFDDIESFYYFSYNGIIENIICQKGIVYIIQLQNKGKQINFKWK